MIELINLTKKFGDFTAVDHLNLTVNTGEFFGLLGPNGAGKTTLFRLILDLYQATKGNVLSKGYD